MPFDPTAATSGASTGGDASQFPGSGLTSAQTDAEYHLGRVLAGIPVILAPTGPSPAPGTEDFFAHEAVAREPQVVTYNQALDAYYALPDDARATLNRQLLEAGAYSKTYYGKRPPIFDPTDDAQGFDAYKKLVQQAARSKTAVSDLITSRIANRKAAGIPSATDLQAGASDRAPFSPVLTNPDDLAAVIKAGAEKILGGRGNVSDAEIAQITAAYQRIQQSAQQQAYNNQATGGASNAAPDPSVYAENQLRAAHPAEANAVGMNTGGNEFLKLLAQVEGKPI